jgi:hypothetical protein
MFNILVDGINRKIYIIDYDENRSTIWEDGCFYFSKNPGKKYNWYNLVKTHYFKVAERLKVLLDTEYNEKVKLAISLLEKHGTTDSVESKKIEEVKSLRGQMKWGGMFRGTTTVSGFPLDEVKSGLQKYVRRGIIFKALLCGVEMYRLGEMGGRAAVTNLYNRIAIIANEDISIANISVAVKACKIVNSKNREPAVLMAIIHQMCLCKKSRLASHVYGAFTSPESMKLARENGIEVDWKVDDSYIQENYNLKVFLEDDTYKMRCLALMFRKYLAEKSYISVNIMSQYWVEFEKVKIKLRQIYPGKRSKSHMVILWDIIREFLDERVVNALVCSFNERSEKRPLIMTAILAIIFDVKMNNDVDSLFSTSVEIWKERETLPKLFTIFYNLELDSYVIDKHTMNGRKMVPTSKFFVNEGATVVNESKIYVDSVLEEIYKCREN